MLQGGSQLVTADIALATSGARVRVFSIVALSGATLGIIGLYNGTSTGGTLYATLTCTAVSTSNIFDFGPSGIVFPAGCFVDLVSNVNPAVVNFVQE